MMMSPEKIPTDWMSMLGKMSWLWMSSPLQRDWTVQTASRFLLPAIAHDQFMLLERGGMPVAYCSWAWLSAEAETRYLLDPSSVRAEDWHSGDRLWFIDWVAPFGAPDSWSLREHMKQRFPCEVARAIRVRRHQSTGRVMCFRGRALPAAEAGARLDRYYADIVPALRAAAVCQSGRTSFN